MAVISFKIPAVVQHLGEGVLLAEGLLYPEISRVNDGLARVLSSLGANARAMLEQTTRLDLHRRRHAGKVELREIKLTLDKPDGIPCWTEPLELRFDVLTWTAGEARMARLPALGIEVVATGKDDLDAMLQVHARAALARSKWAESLRALMRTQRCEEVTLENITVVPQLLQPREAAKAQSEEVAQSVLSQIGVDLIKQLPAEAYETQATVARLADFLGGDSPASVLLVGPTGVGKTAAFNQLVRERAKFKLDKPFWATSGSRLVAGQSGYGMWQQRCDGLRREASKTGAIVHLGPLLELIDVGKAEGLEQGVGGFLRPYIARGELLCVCECTPEQLPLIERQEPQLLNVFQQLRVEEPTPKQALAILRQSADALTKAGSAAPRKGRNGTRGWSPTSPAELSDDGLDKLTRLHRRFATYSAWPGRPLRFVRNLIRDAEPETTLGARDVTAAFSRETGLPLSMLDEDAELKLDELREFFAKRLIAQDRAIDLVVDLLATFKAGLSRPKKPLASYLFIGPTGVGKTEMARTLAEYLFGDRNKLSRFDMSEFADPTSVRRLIAGKHGEGVLTARVREQPFAVILFDEFEKADPSFFDLLLQVLGEGRLTDARGQVADFTTSVIIMTSNLGAQSYMQGGLGFASESAATKAEAHFAKEVRNFLRPELLNRIERIVPFMPLDKAAVTRVAARELELAQRRADAGGRLQIEFAPEVAAHMAAIGWQEKYGARPLKRAIEQHLLVPIASAANERAKQGACKAHVALERGALNIQVKSRSTQKRDKRESAANGLAIEAMELRRRAQQLLKSPATLELASEIYGLEQATRRSKKKKKSAPPPDPRALKRLPRCKEAYGRIETLLLDAQTLESGALMASFGKSASSLNEASGKLRSDWRAALLGLYLLRFENTEFCTLALNGERPALLALAQAYLAQLRATGLDCSLYRFAKELSRDEMRALDLAAHGNAAARRARSEYAQRSQSGAAICVPVLNEDKFFEAPPEGFPTLCIEVLGENALPVLSLEAGNHLVLIEPGQKPLACHVNVIEQGPMDYVMPAAEVRKGMIESAEIRRKYDLPLRKLLDMQLGQVFAWPGREVSRALGEALEAGFSMALEKQVAP
ncbi:MAG: AAA family ATPase [Planctomycetes bacterium]|nr:AAA family ATPase [Planctomycetota bacterium]